MDDFAKRQKLLNDLIVLKCGDRYGNKAAAAAAIKVSYPNFVNMSNGRLRVPMRIIDDMLALPDYVAPELPVILDAAQDMYLEESEDFIKRLTFDMDGLTFNKMSSIAEYHNGGKPVDLTNADNLSKLFSYLIDQEYKACGLSVRGKDDEDVLA